MLQRIYGTAFDDRKELKAYLDRMEEAKSGITASWAASSTFSVYSTRAGFPFFHPKG